GYTTAMFALTSYTLLIIFRNITDGLRNVPAETRDAALGQGLTERQVLFRVELPMAVPEIMAGLRIATSTTVGLAALAVFVGAVAEMLRSTATHTYVSIAALVIPAALAIPLALWLGHIGRGDFLATATSNVGRAVPSLALLAFFISFVGLGYTNVIAVLVLL